MLANLWKYRHFITSSIRNEFANRFARSKLGALWLIINPLTQVLIYALILTNVLSTKLPGIQSKYSYAIYLMAGILCWSLFSEIITRCTNVFIEQSNLIKKMSFPRITLPSIVIGACLLNYFLLLFCMLVIFLFLGHLPSFSMLVTVPLLTLITLTFALGIGLILGVLNVFVRDISQVVPIVMQLWFWFTPIIYPENILPESYRHWLSFNPVYNLINAYHDVFVYGITPNIYSLLETILISSLLMLLGLFIFRRANAEMVDVL
ncbi:Teichoic acid translocation permease protein TagG [Legionella massiliensis]|uniref:Transport permease protein n=1 Tax=Legionella massiliensis TaxID=1034943 RepID=A0A078KTF3_9GAMM|nr:ABC transporter permease [Legionella massiliensis]CDZ76247.1 Teichoic acid translocation permease protein TagG [Legionella massiliensis]CEE11985.1 Teichoic acid translocation permease protein TagG [Legionella massiliensis]